MTDLTRASNGEFGGVGAAVASEHDKTPAQIESDIRRTRDRMSGDIEAIGDKLSPDRIKQRAKEAVSRKTRNVRERIIHTARENPLPTALVAIAIAWLLKSRNKHSGSGNGGSGFGDTVDHAKEKVQELASDAGHKVREISHEASEQAHRAGNRVQRFFEQNPLIGAVGVMALGAVIGAALPHTEKEDRLLGPARDELVDKAQDVAEHAKTTLKETASQSTTGGGSYGAQRQ